MMSMLDGIEPPRGNWVSHERQIAPPPQPVNRLRHVANSFHFVCSGMKR